MDKPLFPEWTGTASSVDQNRIIFGPREEDLKGEVINKYATIGHCYCVRQCNIMGVWKANE